MKSSRIPSRKYGQVFLKSMDVARFEVESLYPEPGESVLEIGPGPGIITSVVSVSGRLSARSTGNESRMLLTIFLLFENNLV